MLLEALNLPPDVVALMRREAARDGDIGPMSLTEWAAYMLGTFLQMAYPNERKLSAEGANSTKH